MITKPQLRIKRCFDFLLSILIFPFLIVPILVLILISSIDTQQWGVFSQKRVGQNGKLFKIYKIRTLKKEPHYLGRLHQSATTFGGFLRNSKLDELPQLFNVLFGHMSFVGPRPDVQGFADELIGEDRVILKVKPGITGPATIKYKDEDVLLAMQSDPETYNRTIIWVDKVEINKKYVQNWSFSLDLRYILQSIKLK
ncbi:sugar transferase [Meridianimaribacter flavus]|uniref:Lipopolysaccharide/colanic/teichoic acid biosynthesis glycosyltransferase n=1 Tax=Meridianimaribacter flavus TaxID=571115 RepID=A0ABY2G4L7_9FLAO|nr:sugar transferase [Meridianimaribacter flavus]TDY11761.1 lipopolysaccharide/colanic/teichoic acid biosynthesis glycosyltransferase [Meridianimaribacter flavus]